MRRRKFIALIGGAAVWPFAAQGPQSERRRPMGVLLPAAEKDPKFRAGLEAFRQVLQELGWVEGRNVRIDIQWAGAKADDIRKHAAELAALAPDVVLAHGASTVGPLLQ